MNHRIVVDGDRTFVGWLTESSPILVKLTDITSGVGFPTPEEAERQAAHIRELRPSAEVVVEVGGHI